MKTIVITGANSGIGYETAKALALNGDLVIAASRDREGTRENVDLLNRVCAESKSQGKVIFYHVDLASFQSVREFIGKVITNYPIIDTLICNAGVMNTAFGHTTDGFEVQFQVNFLSHFMISLGLVGPLLKAENPKIINVCSASAEKGEIERVDTLAAMSRISEDEYDAMTSYRESKLAQQISVIEFTRQEQYKKIKFSLVHPGIVNTNLFYRNTGALYKAAMLPFVYLGYVFGFLKTPKRGAETTVFLSETDDYESGLYWNNQKELVPNPVSINPTYSRALWDWSSEKIQE